MIELSEKTVEFILAEVEAVHVMCDRALVPRESEGEGLSMSQRVNALEICYRHLLQQIGKTDPTIFH